MLKRFFYSLPLKPSIQKAASELFSAPTEVQKKSIPMLCQGHHVVINSETGSGKTLAYLLPMINNLKLHKEEKGPHALVLVPSQHLQFQVMETLKMLTKGMNLNASIIPMPEGIPLSKVPRIDIGVSTPAAIIERYPKYEQIKKLFQNVEQVAMDEVDVLYKDPVSLKLIDYMKRIRKFKSKSKVFMQFSFAAATLAPSLAKRHKNARNLITKEFPDIQFVTTKGVDRAQTGLSQEFVLVDDSFDQKLNLFLESLKRTRNGMQCLVFCSSPSRAKQLYFSIRNLPIKIDVFHGEMKRDERTRILFDVISNPNKSTKNVIISTDLLSRGVDFKNIDIVIHFDFPKNGQDYLHRVGRTARGKGKFGTCN